MQVTTNHNINDTIYVITGKNYDRDTQKYLNYFIEEYLIKSINISFNHKEECKISYRLQSKICSFGFNIKENDEDFGIKYFTDFEEAKERLNLISKLLTT